MEVLAAWLFLFLQLALLYLFWVASLQVPKARLAFAGNATAAAGAVLPDPLPTLFDDKADEESAANDIDDKAKSTDTRSGSDEDKGSEEKTESLLWGQNTIIKWGSEESMERKRSLVIKEIIQTEESYLNSLHQLRDVWIRPMTKSAADRANGLTMKEIQMLSFPSIEMIIALHDTLLPQLKSASDVGAAFVKFGRGGVAECIASYENH